MNRTELDSYLLENRVQQDGGKRICRNVFKFLIVVGSLIGSFVLVKYFLWKINDNKNGIAGNKIDYLMFADPINYKFEEFLVKFNKSYDSDEMKKERQSIFSDNLKYIDEVNKKNLTYKLGVNKFSDMTYEEFKKKYLNCYRTDERHVLNSAKAKGIRDVSLPQHVDWRGKGCITEVKDQGDCGSCYAFGATGLLEGAVCAAHGVRVDLSEKQILDCTIPEGNYGCDGGFPKYVLQYVLKRGLCSEDSYPYDLYGDNDVCKDTNCNSMIDLISYTQSASNWDDIKYFIAVNGPVEVAYYVNDDMMFYESGIFSAACSGDLNHSVLAVGYGKTPTGEDYLIVKNSWGGEWGEAGYFRINVFATDPNGLGECGIFTEPLFADVAKS